MPTNLITKHSTAANTLPTTGNLAIGELAVNVTDKTLFTKNNSNEIIKLNSTPPIASVSSMVADLSLQVGEYVSTEGYYGAGVGAADYKIVASGNYPSTPDEKGAAFTLANGNIAVLKHDGVVTDLQFGIKRDAAFANSGLVQTDGTDNGANLVALLAAAKEQKFQVLFTDGIATTNTPLVMDKTLFSIHGTGKLMSFLNIGASFPVGSSLLTITDCGRTDGGTYFEKPFFTGNEKAVELVGFTLLGRNRTVRANGLSFTGLNDDMIIDVECRDFLGIGMSLGNANVTKVNAGSWVSGTEYKIAFLGTATGDDEDEKEAAIQARWNAYLSTTGVTYRIGSTFTAVDNGATMTGAVAAVGYTSDTVRESTFENIQIKNCGNRNLISGVQYDDAAMEIGSNGSNQGDNNIWFPLLRIIYPRGKALKIVPNVSNRARKLRIGHLFLHANTQLPTSNDPNGEPWRGETDLCIIGTQGAVEGSSEIASVSVDQVDLVGLEVPYKCFVVNTGSSLHIDGFTGNAPDKCKYFYFNGAETSSVRNYLRGGIRVDSPVKSTANLIEVDATNGMYEGHQLSVSGVQAPTVPSGQKKFATLEAGLWTVGNTYVVRDLGTGGTPEEINARWVAYTGINKTWAYGDTFVGTANDSSLLTGAVAGTGGFVEGQEYKIFDLGTAGNAAWNTYLETLGVTYTVGYVFTATSQDSTVLTGAVAQKIYYPSYVGDIKHLNDENVIVANIYKPQDANAGAAFPRTSLYVSRGTTYFQKLYFVTNSALVANDTNYAQIQFIKVNADGTFGGQLARVETKTTASGGTGDWSIGNIIEVPFTETRLDAGEGIAFQINKPSDGGGTGVVVPHLGVVAELSPNLSLQTA